MPTAITHGVVSIVFGKTYESNKNLSFWLLLIFCSIIPDADVITFKLGIPYNNAFGHRGFSHSIVFALFLAVFIVIVFYRKVPRFTRIWWSLLALFFIVTASHAILDAMTNGGLGVAFFAPFNNQRYFFAFRPIKVSTLSISRFFTDSGYKVLLSEMIWVWIPCVIISFIYTRIQRRWLTSASS